VGRAAADLGAARWGTVAFRSMTGEVWRGELRERCAGRSVAARGASTWPGGRRWGRALIRTLDPGRVLGRRAFKRPRARQWGIGAARRGIVVRNAVGVAPPPRHPAAMGPRAWTAASKDFPVHPNTPVQLIGTGLQAPSSPATPRQQLTGTLGGQPHSAVSIDVPEGRSLRLPARSMNRGPTSWFAEVVDAALDLRYWQDQWRPPLLACGSKGAR